MSSIYHAFNVYFTLTSIISEALAKIIIKTGNPQTSQTNNKGKIKICSQDGICCETKEEKYGLIRGTSYTIIGSLLDSCEEV